MVIADDAVESAPEPRRRSGWAADNPLVRAVGRVRLPLGGKLIVGFCVVGALLAVGYALGIVALGQSNSRGEQVRSLQQTAAFARIVEADANQLGNLVGQRSSGPDIGVPALPAAASAAVDSDVFKSWQQFLADIQLPALAGGLSGYVRSFGPRFVPKLKATLRAFETVWVTVTAIDQKGTNPPALARQLAKASQLAAQTITEANSLDAEMTSRANALVAANHSGFVNSRNLLIGVGAGSLALALALGLLLSLSVVAPFGGSSWMRTVSIALRPAPLLKRTLTS